MKRNVFISYSSHDKPIAEAICAKLEQDNIQCWIAPRDILPGIEFGEAIIEGIESCRIMVLVFSSSANESPQVRREVERALSKGNVIIPFRIENVLPTKAMEYALSNTHWLDAMSPPLEHHIAKLSNIICQLLGQLPSPFKPGVPRKTTIRKWLHITWVLVIIIGFLFFFSVKYNWQAAFNSSNNFQTKTPSTIVIGDQIWATQNLDVSTFNNGDQIPEAKTNEEWIKAGESKTPAWCYYGNDPASGRKYGKLYNWYVVSDPRGIAPDGFHVPSKTEFNSLITNCGGEGDKAYSALIPSGSTKFNSLFGGSRMVTGLFLLQTNAAFWSSSEGYRGSGAAFHLIVDSEKKMAKIMYYYNSMGFSIRCLKGPKVEDDNPVDKYRRMIGKDPEGLSTTSSRPSLDTISAEQTFTPFTRARTLDGHKGAVFALAFSSDGRQIGSGSWDHTAKLWNVIDGTCLRTFIGHNDKVTAVSYADQAGLFITGCNDGTIKIWDVASGKCVKSFQAHSKSVRSIHVYGDKILSCGEDDLLKFWDLSSEENRDSVSLGLTMAFSCAISYRSNLIAIVGSRPIIQIRNLNTGEQLQHLGEHDSVLSVGFLPDGKSLMSGSGDGSLRLWDLSTSKCVRTFTGHQKAIVALGYLNDGAQLISGSMDKSIKIWDRATGKCIQSLDGDTSMMLSMAVSPDGRCIVSGGADNSLKIWRQQITSTPPARTSK